MALAPCSVCGAWIDWGCVLYLEGEGCNARRAASITDLDLGKLAEYDGGGFYNMVRFVK